MEDKIFKINAYLYNGLESEEPIIYYQNDTEQCGIEVLFFGADSLAYDITATQPVVVVDKSDGTEVIENMTIDSVENNKAALILHSQSIASIGKNTMTIILYGNDGQRQTFGSLKFTVKNDGLTDGILSDTNYPILTNLLSEVRNLEDDVISSEYERTIEEGKRTQAEEYRGIDEQDRKRAEEERGQNEAFRQNSEGLRNSAETMRADNETFRDGNENDRVTNEINRVATENLRVASENTRKTNEIDRVFNEGNRVAQESIRIGNEYDRCSNENERISNEDTRVSEFNTIKSDYQIYKDLMIDENIAANLQSQVNTVNSSLAEIAINVKSFGAKGDGITDDTIAIQNAINYATTLGGIVFIPSGTHIASQIVLKSNVTIRGVGYKSVLKQKGGSTTHFIVLYNDVQVLCGLEDLYIDGNKGNQTTPNDGVRIINSSTQPEDIIDHYLTFKNIHIENCSGNGLYMYYTRESILDSVIIRQCDLDGFYLQISDSKIAKCTASTSNIGFNIHGNNMRLSDCKAFFNQYGFKIVSYSLAGNMLVNCETQSNFITGYWLKDTQGCMFRNILTDTDEQCGILFENVSNCYIGANIINHIEMTSSKIGIKNIGTLSENVINITRSFNSTFGFVDFSNTNNEIDSTTYININGEETYNFNLFKYDYKSSLESGNFNTLTSTVSDALILYNKKFSKNKTIFTITSNPTISNYGSLMLVDNDFRVVDGSDVSLKLSLSAKFEKTGNFTPKVAIDCFNSSDVNLGKVQDYVYFNGTAKVTSLATELPVGTKKVKIHVGADLPQTVVENGAIGWSFTVWDINFITSQ